MFMFQLDPVYVGNELDFLMSQFMTHGPTIIDFDYPYKANCKLTLSSGANVLGISKLPLTWDGSQVDWSEGQGILFFNKGFHCFT